MIRVLQFALVLAWLALPGWANNKVVVYIECTHPEKPVSQGSGVVVSPEGHVLTARHVVPDGYTCRGALENRTNPMRGLIRPVQDRNLDAAIDGKLLRFVPNVGEVFEYATYCPVSADLVAQEMIAKGFHRTSVAFPSATSGVLSTHILNDVGIVETDAMTISGKSGGPIFLGDSSKIIGVVAGGAFESATGQPAYYGALAVDAVVFAFRVMTQSEDCKIGAAGPSQDVRNDTDPTTWVALKPDASASVDVQALAIPEPPETLTRGASAGELARAADLYAQAVSMFENDQYQSALALISSAIEIDPTNAIYYNDRGYARLENDELEAAKADFDKALALDDTLVDAYANRAEYYEYMGDWAQAVADYDKLLALDPTNTDGLLWRAESHFELGNMDAALDDYNTAMVLDGQSGAVVADPAQLMQMLGLQGIVLE